VGLLGFALYAQYGLGLEPCPLCILQRVAVLVVGLLFVAAFIHDPGDRGARVYGSLIDLAALAGIAVAARQIWIIAQPPGSVAECGASLDYMMAVLPWHEVLAKVLTGSGECAKVDWLFLGLNMPTWVLISLVVVGTWGLAVNWAGRRSG
jgi:disulfide bond formation protein DsbB